MKLFLLTWEFEQYDRECEWTHVVLKEYPSPEQIDKIIADFMLENHEESPEDYEIENYWCNTVEMVDGYRIRVEGAQNA